MTLHRWWVTAGVLVAIAAALVLSRPQEAVVPADVFTPRHKETRPMFTSCTHARIAGAPLPITVGDPGFNPRLDHDSNGVIC